MGSLSRRCALSLTVLVAVALAACGIASPAPVAPPSPVVVPTATVVPSALTPGQSLLHPASQFSTYGNLRYSKAASNSYTLLDLYVPNNGWAYCPLVIWIHGGGWAGLSKTDNIGFLYGLLAKGFAVASINYRLTDMARWPAQIIDVKTAIRYLRANGAARRVWTGKVGVWGNSAGGHLAAMAAVTNGKADWDSSEWPGTSSAVQAAQDDSGISDVLKWAGPPLPPAGDVDTVWIAPLLGAHAAAVPDRARDASPIHWVSPGDAPIHLWHGTADTFVPPYQATDMQAALAAAGVPNTLTWVSGMNHGDFSYYTSSRVAGVATWFDSILRP